ncbi:uncharacterized protein LOC119022498 [Acanthopagrus latus]|uniref:uncharacterized protein LOC119022498 n=1 Tax=Acanthopagrus latus TaxID=8177 RepID=UPI00187CA287|nr:uncharacterized protein LOC119022498 [Acanthopagrus latus]
MKTTQFNDFFLMRKKRKEGNRSDEVQLEANTGEGDAGRASTAELQGVQSSTTPGSGQMEVTPHLVPVTTKQVIKVRLVRKDSSLDLNNSDVMEQMLKEVQQRLKDQGVKGDVKLSWRKQADGKVFHEEEEETKEKKTRRKRDEI